MSTRALLILAAFLLAPFPALAEECDILALCPAAAPSSADPTGGGDACVITGTHLLANNCVLDFTGRMVTIAPTAILQAGGSGYTITLRAGKLAHQGLLQAPSGTIDLQVAGDITTSDAGGNHGRIDVNAAAPTSYAGTVKARALRLLQLGSTVTATGGLYGGVIEVEGCGVTVSGGLDAQDPSGSNPGVTDITYHDSYAQPGSVRSNGNTLTCEQAAGSSPPACKSAPPGSLDTVPAFSMAYTTQPCGGCGTRLVTPGAPCDDGDACTQNEVCLADGRCVPYTLTSCDDGNPCTLDTCDHRTGQCTHTAEACAFNPITPVKESDISPASVGTSQLGYALAEVGDPAQRDVLVGAPTFSTSTTSRAGRAYRLDGKTLALKTTYGPFSIQDRAFGFAVAAFGPDLLISAPNCGAAAAEYPDSFTGVWSGHVYLVDGTNGTLKHTFSTPAPDCPGGNCNAVDCFGTSVASDGVNVAIVARNLGKIYLFDGSSFALKCTYQANPLDVPSASAEAVALVGDKVEATFTNQSLLKNGIYTFGTGTDCALIGGGGNSGPAFFGYRLATLDRGEFLYTVPRASNGSEPTRVRVAPIDPTLPWRANIKNPTSADPAPPQQNFGLGLGRVGPNALIGAPNNNSAYIYDPDGHRLATMFLPSCGSSAPPCVPLTGGFHMGNAVVARGDHVLASLLSQTASGTSQIEVYSPTCGNGIVDVGEECDDGNRRDDDCCTSDCHLVPKGSYCNLSSGRDIGVCDAPGSSGSGGGTCVGPPCRVGLRCPGNTCPPPTWKLQGTTCVCTAG